MLVMEAERFGGPQVLTARHAVLESRLAVAKTLLRP